MAVKHAIFWGLLASILGETLPLALSGGTFVERLLGGSIIARVSYSPLFEELDVSIFALWLAITLPLALAAYRLRPWRMAPKPQRLSPREEPRL